MNSLISRRVIDEVKYMIETKKTRRELAKIFKVSKSTIHKDLHDRLNIKKKYNNLFLFIIYFTSSILNK